MPTKLKLRRSQVEVNATMKRALAMVGNRVIEELPLSIRSYNVLKDAGINTVGQLCVRSRDELLEIKHLGPMCMKEIERVLVDRRLQLPGTEER